MRSSLLAFTALAALTLGQAVNAQPGEHRDGGRPTQAASSAPAPAPAPSRAQPAPPAAPRGYGGGPRFQPQGDRGFSPGPRFQPQRAPAYNPGNNPAQNSGEPRFRPQGDARLRGTPYEGDGRGGYARPYGQPYDRGARPPAYQGQPTQPRPTSQYGQAIQARPAYEGRQGVYPGSPARTAEAGRQDLAPGTRFYQTRPAYDQVHSAYGQRQGFIGNIGDRHDGDRHDGDHHDGDHRDGDHRDGDHHDGDHRHFDGAREYGHEQREWQREGGFHHGGDFDRYRHDYEYHDWHGDHDRDRLLIINRYGYSPWGYGFRSGWNDYGLNYWGGNLGWGFDLRFGYWYGPSYYDPGYNWFYGPQAPYQYGVRAEELILRDSTLHDWALQYFDYNRDGYLDRDEVRAAARALRQIADYNGDGWIQASEYSSAIERLSGRSQGYGAYDQRQAYDQGPGYDDQAVQPYERQPY